MNFLFSSRKIRLPYALLFGIALGTSYFNLWLTEMVKSLPAMIFTWVYLVLFYSLACYIILALVNRQTKRRLLLGGVWLVVFLGSVFFVIQTVKNNVSLPVDVEVMALGERNPLSQGGDVWIREIRVDNQTLPVADLKLDPAWEIRDGVPLSSKNQPGSVQWHGRFLDKIVVELITSPWSGKVKLNISGQEEILDLYASNNSSVFVEKTAETIWNQNESQQFFGKVIKFGASGIILSFPLLLGVMVIFRTRG